MAESSSAVTAAEAGEALADVAHRLEVGVDSTILEDFEDAILRWLGEIEDQSSVDVNALVDAIAGHTQQIVRQIGVVLADVGVHAKRLSRAYEHEAEQ